MNEEMLEIYERIDRKGNENPNGLLAPSQVLEEVMATAYVTRNARDEAFGGYTHCRFQIGDSLYEYDYGVLYSVHGDRKVQITPYSDRGKEFCNRKKINLFVTTPTLRYSVKVRLAHLILACSRPEEFRKYLDNRAKYCVNHTYTERTNILSEEPRFLEVITYKENAEYAAFLNRYDLYGVPIPSRAKKGLMVHIKTIEKMNKDPNKKVDYRAYAAAYLMRLGVLDPAEVSWFSAQTVNEITKILVNK